MDRNSKEYMAQVSRARATEMAMEWIYKGQPIREKGSREGDNDRMEILTDIVTNHPRFDAGEVSEVLAKWHEEYNSFVEFESLLIHNGGNPRRFWDAVGNTEHAEDCIIELVWANISEDTDEEIADLIIERALALI